MRQLTYRICKSRLLQDTAIDQQENRPILSEDSKTRFLRRLRRALAWGRLNLPYGLRTVLGLVLLAGGVFWFLPILGFWMIPLGLALIALDIPPLRRRLRSWLHHAVRRREGKRADRRKKMEQ